jgi:hypothetical protein
VNKRKDFDKLVQKCKRQYWYRSQEELIRLSDTDSKQFWRKIGKIGIGNQRQSNIPNEITLDDGSIRVIPLYDKGSRGSEVEHFGIGVIIPLLHILGTLPVLTHTLNDLCNTNITI